MTTDQYKKYRGLDRLNISFLERISFAILQGKSLLILYACLIICCKVSR